MPNLHTKQHEEPHIYQFLFYHQTAVFGYFWAEASQLKNVLISLINNPIRYSNIKL